MNVYKTILLGYGKRIAKAPEQAFRLVFIWFLFGLCLTWKNLILPLRKITYIYIQSSLHHKVVQLQGMREGSVEGTSEFN